SSRLNAAKPAGIQASDIAFLAMAQFQTGDRVRAKAGLARLRKLLDKPEQAKEKEYQESRGFLREAEALIESQSTREQKRQD
ncbi:MAG: hypothetical protein ACE5F1_10610, partial [Planctomycetota bacterium]